jgi:hypothetical protein
MIDYAALKTELTTDPAALGYSPHVAAGEDGALEQLINAPNAAWVKKMPQIPIPDVLSWAAGGPIAPITDASNNTASPVRGICLAALRMFNGTQTALDVSRSDVQAMFGNLVAAGTITQAQHDSLMNLQNVSPASRAEVLWGPGTVIGHLDIAKALRS